MAIHSYLIHIRVGAVWPTLSLRPLGFASLVALAFRLAHVCHGDVAGLLPFNVAQSGNQRLQPLLLKDALDLGSPVLLKKLLLGQILG